MFSLQPSSDQGGTYVIKDDDEIRWGKDVAIAASEGGIPHLVYSSASAAGPGKSGMGQFESKTEIEEYIHTLSVPSTIIRPNTFMEIPLMPGLGL